MRIKLWTNLRKLEFINTEIHRKSRLFTDPPTYYNLKMLRWFNIWRAGIQAIHFKYECIQNHFAPNPPQQLLPSSRFPLFLKMPTVLPNNKNKKISIITEQFKTDVKENGDKKLQYIASLIGKVSPFSVIRGSFITRYEAIRANTSLKFIFIFQYHCQRSVREQR